MKEINLDTWDRKEHFNVFMQSDLPFYNVNFNVNVAGLRECCKRKGISVTNALMHSTLKALIRIDNFLYRFEKGKVVQYDTIDASFTYMRENEELFRLITVNFQDDISAFDRSVKNAIANNTLYFDVSMLKDRSNFVFISILPWIPFTGIDHTQSLKKEDAIPRITWGKMHEIDGKTILPFNIQVNHIFIDGIHVGRFYEFLIQEVQNLIK